MSFPDSYVREAVNLLKEMASIPTVNPPGEHYADFAAFAAETLGALGFNVSLIEIPESFLDQYYPYAPSHRGYPRYIVYAKLGSGRPVLHFNGHYDVVPPGSGWTKDPFTPVEEGGRVYGRGTTDMKGGIAAFVAAAKSVIDEGFPLGGALEVVLVPDEEAGGVGTRYFAARRFSVPDYVVIGEPTTRGVIGIGHKGLVRALVKVYGRQAHGSTPWLGDNAFVRAAKLVLRFLEVYEPLLKSRKTSAPVIYEEGVYPTVNVGGYAESMSRKDNMVPGEFRFSIDRRVIPEEDIECAVRELSELLESAAREVGAKLSLEILSKVEPSMTPPDSAVVRVAEACVLEELSMTPKVFLGLGRNDAVFYTNILGSHAITYGPGVQDTAHTADEYTTVDELAAAIKVYRCIVLKVLGRKG